MKKQIVVSFFAGFVMCVGVGYYALKYTSLPSLIWNNVWFLTPQETSYMQYVRDMIPYYKSMSYMHPDVPFSIEVPVLWKDFSDPYLVQRTTMTPSIARHLLQTGRFTDATWQDIITMSDKQVLLYFSDTLRYPLASVAQNSNPNYGDWVADQVDFFVLDGAYPDALPEGAVTTTVDGYSAIIEYMPLDNGEVTKGGTGGKTVSIYVPQKKKVLVMQQQARGDEYFEQTVTHIINTLNILL